MPGFSYFIPLIVCLTQVYSQALYNSTLAEGGLTASSAPFSDYPDLLNASDTSILRLSSLRICSTTSSTLSGVQATVAQYDQSADIIANLTLHSVGQTGGSCSTLNLNLTSEEFVTNMTFHYNQNNIKFLIFTTNEGKRLFKGSLTSGLSRVEHAFDSGRQLVGFQGNDTTMLISKLAPITVDAFFDPWYVAPPEEVAPEEKEPLRWDMVLFIVIGVVAFIIVVAVIVYCCYNMQADGKKSKNNGQSTADQSKPDPSEAKADVEKGNSKQIAQEEPGQVMKLEAHPSSDRQQPKDVSEDQTNFQALRQESESENNREVTAGTEVDIQSDYHEEQMNKPGLHTQQTFSNLRPIEKRQVLGDIMMSKK